MSKKNHFNKVKQDSSKTSRLNTDSKTKFKRKKRDKKNKSAISVDENLLVPLQKKLKPPINRSETVQAEVTVNDKSSITNNFDKNTVKRAKKKNNRHTNEHQEHNNTSNASHLNSDFKNKRKRKHKNSISSNAATLKNKELSQNLTPNLQSVETNNSMSNMKASKSRKNRNKHNNYKLQVNNNNSNESGKSFNILKGSENSEKVKTKKKKNKLHDIKHPAIQDSDKGKNSDEINLKIRNDQGSEAFVNSNKQLNKKKTKHKVMDSVDHQQKKKGLVHAGLDAINSDDKSDLSEFDMDSYPSDTDDEAVIPISNYTRNFADESSAESSLSESDNESQHTFDADSYPSDSDDEDEKKKGFPINAIPSAELKEREKRTIFVGNLPYSVERMDLKKWFFKFGPVECVRLRSAPIADPEISRKVSVIKKAFHESRSNIHAYIRFKTIEAAKNALQANGALFKDHVLRVDSSVHEGKYDTSKGIFVGNLPFSIEEDNLRQFFIECGEIESVRIIRDKNTGVGKGFGYVNFKCSTSVPLALKCDGETLEKREIRVKPIKYQKKNAILKKHPPPQYHNKKFFKKPLKKDKSRKTNKFQGEIAEKTAKKHPKKKTAEEKKREKFSQILTKKNSKI